MSPFCADIDDAVNQIALHDPSIRIIAMVRSGVNSPLSRRELFNLSGCLGLEAQAAGLHPVVDGGSCALWNVRRGGSGS